MAGSYCKFCDRRCFVYRIIPAEPGVRSEWAGHLATCARGKEFDRQQTGGFDSTNTINPMTAERIEQLHREIAEADATARRLAAAGELHDELFWRTRIDHLSAELDDLRS